MLRLVSRSTHGNQRKLKTKCVNHVSGHAGEAVKKGEGTKDDAGNFRPNSEGDYQQCRHQKLEQRSAPESESLPEPAEQKVSSFMSDQVDVVEKRGLAEMCGQIKQNEAIKDQPRDELRAPDRQPLNLFHQPLLRT